MDESVNDSDDSFSSTGKKKKGNKKVKKDKKDHIMKEKFWNKINIFFFNFEFIIQLFYQ